jgi:hypothetical protein
MVDYSCPENLYPKTKVVNNRKIISNGCAPETGDFPGKFVEVDVPSLGYHQPLYRKFGNVYTILPR